MRQTQMGTIKRLMLLVFLIAIGSTGAFAQELKISGEVVDEHGEAIPGVNVVVKGTTNGSITDIDGKFSLSAKKGDVIKFSFIGFKDQEIIAQNTTLNVTLLEESIGLDEVVAVGYGTMRKSDLTGSVARVSADMFKDQNNVSIDQTLTARVAGVQVVSNSGAPGAGVSIRIRGGTSINASNEPLYVIDGIPFVNDNSNGATAGIGFDSENPMVNIDPSDIESIEVLKDASATAIYGSRGANGVILVTTRGGKSGKTNLVYNASFGVSNVTNKLDLMNGEEYASFMHLADPTDERFTDIDTGEAISYADSTSMNWQDEVFRAAKVQNHNLSMTGGNDKTRYAFSLGYLDNEGVVINTKLSRYSTRIKVEHDYSDFLTLGANYSAGLTEENGIISAGTQSGSNAGIITNLIVFRPTALNDTDGEEDDFDLLGNKTNPLVFANEVEKTTTTLRNVGNVDLKLNFTKHLSLKVTGGANINNVKRKQYYPSNVGPGRNTNGKGIQSDIMRIVWLNDNILTYNRKFGKHRINAMAGISTQKSVTEKLDVTNTEYDIEQNAVHNIGSGTAPLIPTSAREEWALYSYLGRVNYNFNNRYLMTASFRADGSSRFGANNRYGYFPSFSAAWRVSEEPFMKSIPAISNLKLRAGWGQTGNQGIGLFSYLEMLRQANYSFGGSIQTGIQPNNIGNPDLKWETTAQVNVGMDLGIFNNRISFVIDAYDKYTDDLLLNMPLSQVSGYETVMANIGAVSNKGLELAINTVNVDNANFKWFTDFNIAFNKNRIEKLVNAGQDIYVNARYNSTVPVTYVLREGESVGSMFGYVWDKNDALYQIDDFTWQENSNPDIAHEDRQYVLKDDVAAIAGSTVKPGYLKYQNTHSEDVDGDGVITPEEQVIDSEDRQIIGNGLPKHFGGLTNTFKFKGFDCIVGLQWSYGNDIYNANKFDYMRPNIAKNQHVDILDAWTPENTNTIVPSLTGFGAVLPSSYVVEDGSYIRLNNVTIGYTLPRKFVKKLSLSKVRIYASGMNLYTWTNYSGFTPDVSVSGGVSKSLLPGLDYSSYPQVMTIMGGLSVNF
ncbi:MAG: TonB-dependent receptor [Bacteroidales bacterium]|nr:TonB-dependent receptor [Bacteroidales bacterium]